MSETLVERMARAIADADIGTHDGLPLGYNALALAALRAIREPTKPVISALAHQITGGIGATCCHVSGGHGPKNPDAYCECRDIAHDGWIAGVDAAIAEAGGQEP